MTLVADYRVIDDPSFRLDVGEAVNLSFTLPDSAALDHPGVLFFRTLVKNVEEYHFEILINKQSVFTFVASGQLPLAFNSFHEVIGTGVLKHGENVLRILGSGLLFDKGTFSDFLLMFKRAV